MIILLKNVIIKKIVRTEIDRMEKLSANQLIDFLYESPTTFHHVLKIQSTLDENGYVELKESEKWAFKKSGKYYLKKNDSAIIAFEIGTGNIEEHGMRFIGAHTDSPSFKVKSSSEMVAEGTYLKLNTEMYGGGIAYTWFDRPLALAGKVTLRSENLFSPEIKLINMNKPLLTIPSVAIHLNRTANEKFAVNKQKDTLPLMGLVNNQFEKDGYLLKVIAKELGINVEEILGFDLNLYEYEKGSLVGINEEFISCGDLDDKWMTYSGLMALIESKSIEASKMLICVDNEEIGSLTAQGANSNFILNVIERIMLALGKDREEMHRALSKSVMISADLAHAVHPNSGELHDPTNRPVLGKGPVLKVAAAGSYSTDSYGMALFKGLCESAQIPYQVLYNRSDVRGGTTIGPITSSLLTIPVIDMGAPLLAMHSIRELASVKDHELTLNLFKTFFNA